MYNRIKIVFNKREILCVAMLLCFSLLVVSCISKNNQPIQVNYYDLGIPQDIEIKNVNLEIVPFSNYSEVNSEMLYRLGENQVDLDPYNQWVEPPNIMLTNFFKRAITLNYEKNANNGAEPLSMTLHVSVTAFDIDLRSNKAILAVTYKVKYQGSILLAQNRVFEQSLKEKTPIAFAGSMSLASSEFLNLICSQVNELKTNLMSEKEL